MIGSVTLPQAIARLKDFDKKALKKALKGGFYQALDVGRQAALAELRHTEIGQMVQRRGEVQLQLGMKSRSKKWSSPETLAMLQQNVIPLIVRRDEMKQSLLGVRLSSGLVANGFAALIAAGARTKSHQIKRIRLGGYSRRRSTRAKQVQELPPMTFQVGGRWVSARVVTHPGSRVPRIPFLETGARATERALPERLTASIGSAIREAGI
jgi:hypothetical protein